MRATTRLVDGALNRRAGTVALYLAGLLVAVIALAKLGLTVNTTSSMPIGLYRVHPAAAIERGATVQVCAPDEVARLGAARGYLPPGNCASGRAPLLKIAVGIPGDIVVVRNDAITVNGQRLTPSARASHDTRGRPLDRIPVGTYVLGADQLWLWTPYARSWDSRYFGPVSLHAVRGVARLLIPFARLGDGGPS